MSDAVVSKNESQRRYELRLDGELAAFSEYNLLAISGPKASVTPALFPCTFKDVESAVDASECKVCVERSYFFLVLPGVFFGTGLVSLAMSSIPSPRMRSARESSSKAYTPRAARHTRLRSCSAISAC